MNFIAWNVRGIGGAGKSRAIMRLIVDKKPMIIGLVETKHSEVTVQKINKWWRSKENK